MPKFERRALQFIEKHFIWILMAGVVVISAVVRFQMRGFSTRDLEVYLEPWFAALRQGGLAAVLALPNFNYNVAYCLLLWPATALPWPDAYAIKLVSILFDYLGAGAAGFVMWQLLGKQAPNRKSITLSAVMLVLLLPLPMANSAMWGQCDMIYTTFILLCLGLLYAGRVTPAFTMFALACCFKLQAVFFLPVLIIYYVCEKRFSLLQFLQAPLAVVLLGLFGRGRGDSLFLGLELYLNQAESDQRLYADYPNLFYAFRDQYYAHYALAAVAFTLGIFLCMLGLILYKKWRPRGDALLLLTAWSVLTCCCLLPGMHDRYGFVAELVVWLFFLARPSVKRFALALAVNFAPLLIYVRALVREEYLSLPVLSVINLLVYVVVSVVTVRYLRDTHGAAYD